MFERNTKKILNGIVRLEKKVETLMATVETAVAAFNQLKTDIEDKAAEAKAEFAKLEKEVQEGKPVNLAPLQSSIEGLDSAVKSAVVPSA